MRRLKPVFLNVKNIGRDGKKITQSIPLRVDIGPRQPENITEEKNKDIDSAVEQDVPLDDLDKQQPTTQQQSRVLSISDNWEKVREKLLNSYIEEQHLPDNVNCVNCQERIATTRCEYCGPHQYFCVGCARALHVNRNKFHVLEQWKVCMNVFWPVVFYSSYFCSITYLVQLNFFLSLAFGFYIGWGICSFVFRRGNC